jgi:hypothetical protein
MNDEALEKQLNNTHQTGISEGLRRSAKHIMEAARDAFERFGGDDRTAVRLRHLANELHVMANIAHPGTLDPLPAPTAPANVCPLPQVKCSGEEAPVGTFTCPPSCRTKEVEK